jgi:hypothetical protein
MIESMKSFKLVVVLAVIATSAVSTQALAQAGRKENVIDGLLMTATPKTGKWMSKKISQAARVGSDGFLREKDVELGDCPLEIVDVSRVPLYKTDDAGKPIRSADSKLISGGWVYQQFTDSFTKKPDFRYFIKRTTKDGQPVLEPGGTVGDMIYEKDSMLGSYYSLDITVDHFGVGRLAKLAPTFPMRMMPSKEELHLSRYDVGANGRSGLVKYNVQEKLVGTQGELTVTENGVTKKTGHGKPNEAFYKVELELDTVSLEPVYLTYTAGIATNKDGDSWLFADTAEYHCKDFKKVD